MTKTTLTMEVAISGKKKVNVRYFCTEEAYPDRPSLADLYCTIHGDPATAPIEIKEIIHRKIVTNSEVLHETVREIVEEYFSGEAKPSIPGEHRG